MANQATEQVMFRSPTTGAVQPIDPENWDAALSKGYQPTTHKVMYSPEGKRGMVSNEEADSYAKQGYTTDKLEQETKKAATAAGAPTEAEPLPKEMQPVTQVPARRPTKLGTTGGEETAYLDKPMPANIARASQDLLDEQGRFGAAQKHASESITPMTNAVGVMAPVTAARSVLGSRVGAFAGREVLPRLPYVGKYINPDVASAVLGTAGSLITGHGEYEEPPVVAKGQQNISNALRVTAGKAGQKAKQMADDLQVATPDLAAIEKETPSQVTSILKRGKGSESFHELADKIDNRQEQMWEEGHKPGIARHAKADTNSRLLYNAGIAQIDEAARDAAPSEAAAAEKWLTESVNKPRTLDSLDKLVREINDDLKGKGAETRYGPLQVRVRQAVVKAARAEIDNVLEKSGEQGVRGVNRRYGALGNISDRLKERAVQEANREARGGPLPDWAHTYIFMHPNLTAAVGAGVRMGSMLAPEAGTQLTRGMRQLGSTSLEAPFEATSPYPPVPIRGLLPERGTTTPLVTPPPDLSRPPYSTPPVAPNYFGPRALLPERAGGPYAMPPVENGAPFPQGSREALRASGRDVGTGRFQRFYLTGSPTEEIGVAGNERPGRIEREPAHPTRREVQQSLGERRSTPRATADTSREVDPIRQARMENLRKQLRSPNLNPRDRRIFQGQLDDMEAHPGERNDLGENPNQLKKEKPKLSREEAEANQKKRGEARTKRFKKKENE